MAEPDGGGCDHRRQGSCDRRKGHILSGQMVKAQELRGGAALVIAALMAQGITRVYGSAFIERGYEDLAGDLRKLGAVISKKKAER